MRIVSNKIFTGKAKSFDDFIKESTKSNKVASENNVVKTASSDNVKEEKVATSASSNENVVSKDEKVVVAEFPFENKKEEKNEGPKDKKEEKVEDKKEDKKEEKVENKKEEKKEDKEACMASANSNKEASENSAIKQGIEWGKLRPVANLTKEQKTKVYDYWRNLYGEDYAKAMTQDS